MDTHLHKSVLIDLFNLPPLPDKRNTEESYMDMPYNYNVMLKNSVVSVEGFGPDSGTKGTKAYCWSWNIN